MMSNKEYPEVGSITWFDLTVPDAERVKDFYGKVVGWKAMPVSQPKADEPLAQMGDYNDYNMNLPESGKTNADKVLSGPKDMSNYGRYCVIEDPAGAVCTLFEPV